MSPQGDVTGLLRRLREGERDVEAELYRLLSGELRLLANRHLRRERKEHTLRATALVNEAYLKLAGTESSCQDRNHFLAVASRAMRQILVDYARGRAAAKRDHGIQVEMEDAHAPCVARTEDILALEEALSRLSELDPRQCQIVEMRFFGGLTEEEIADTLGISSRTVKREWKMARAWLHDQLGR